MWPNPQFPRIFSYLLKKSLIWNFLICTNFSRTCWKTTCVNTLQFLFQIFKLFNPVSNILGTCKLNFILYLFKYCYQQILRKICRLVTKAEHEEIILYEFGKWWYIKQESYTKQPFADVFKMGVLKIVVVFTGKHLCWSLFLITFLARGLQQRCFPVNFAKFLRTAFL